MLQKQAKMSVTKLTTEIVFPQQQTGLLCKEIRLCHEQSTTKIRPKRCYCDNYFTKRNDLKFIENLSVSQIEQGPKISRIYVPVILHNIQLLSVKVNVKMSFSSYCLFSPNGGTYSIHIQFHKYYHMK